MAKFDTINPKDIKNPDCGHKIRFRTPTLATYNRMKNFHVENHREPEQMFKELPDQVQDLVSDLTKCITHMVWEEIQLDIRPLSKDSLVSDLINLTNQFKLEAMAAEGDEEMAYMVTPLASQPESEAN